MVNKMVALQVTKTRPEALREALEAPEKANRKGNQRVDNQKGDESIAVEAKTPAKD